MYYLQLVPALTPVGRDFAGTHRAARTLGADLLRHAGPQLGARARELGGTWGAGNYFC